MITVAERIKIKETGFFAVSGCCIAFLEKTRFLATPKIKETAIPCFPLPLRGGDVEPIVDLQALLNTVYDRAAYDITLDYTAQLVPALSESDAVWADSLPPETSLKPSETSKILHKTLQIC